ncbi:hypothetical protein V8E51_013894 [Hyaloscypha variabilis]
MTINDPRPKPPAGPVNAAVEGWKHHLVVKGFNSGGSEFSIRSSVHLFLEALFGLSAEPPVQYGFHDPVVETQGNAGRVLRFSLTRNDHLAVAPEEALQRFCDRFFEQKDHAICHKLTDYGMLGFSPEEDRFKICWYRALFTYMHNLRREQLLQMDQEMATIKSRSGATQANWYPVWAGAATLLVSLGSAHLFSLRRVKLRGGSLLGNKSIDPSCINIADRILQIIAGSNEDMRNVQQEAQQVSQKLKDLCTDFIQHSEGVIPMMRRNGTYADLPEPVVHRRILETIVFLIEKGFQTVTLSKKAVDAFIEIRNTSLTASMFAFTNAGISGYNAVQAFQRISELSEEPLQFTDSLVDKAKKFFGAIEQTPGEVRAATERADAIRSLKFDGVFAGLQAAYGVYQFGQSAYEGYSAQQEKQKWREVALYISSSIRHSQMAEIYLHWTYNTGDGVQSMSPQYLGALEVMTRSLDSSVPTLEETTPEAIRARLVQQANILEDEKNAVRKRVGLS